MYRLGESDIFGALYFNHELRRSLLTTTMGPSKAGECEACVYKIRALTTLAYGDVRATFLDLKSSLQAIFLGTKFYPRASYVLG